MKDDLKAVAIGLIAALNTDTISEAEFERHMTAVLDSLPPSDRVPFALDVREMWVENELQQTDSNNHT